MTRSEGYPVALPAQRLESDPACELAIGRQIKTEDVGNGRRDIRIADRRRILKAHLEIRTYRSHVVKGAVSPEPAVHALPLLKAGVGNLYRSLQIMGFEVKHFETDNHS